jgi:hypothetical protein
VGLNQEGFLSIAWRSVSLKRRQAFLIVFFSLTSPFFQGKIKKRLDGHCLLNEEKWVELSGDTEACPRKAIHRPTQPKFHETTPRFWGDSLKEQHVEKKLNFYSTKKVKQRTRWTNLWVNRFQYC